MSRRIDFENWNVYKDLKKFVEKNYKNNKILKEVSVMLQYVGGYVDYYIWQNKNPRKIKKGIMTLKGKHVIYKCRG